MVRFELTEDIAAPIERCFDLARSVDLHVKTALRTHEQAVAGCTSGLIGPGETVTWRGKHFGLWFFHTSRITAFDRPRYFQDSMLKGSFKRYQHGHAFHPQDGKTQMTDIVEFEAPFGILGRIAEKLFLERHLKNFVRQRNAHIKRIAESGEWSRLVSSST